MKTRTMLMTVLNGGGVPFPYSIDFSAGSLGRLNGATWTVSAGKATNTPNLGPELVTNGDMELDSGWANDGTPTANERSGTQKHGGTYSRRATTDANAEGIKSAVVTVAANRWYRASSWFYLAVGDAADGNILAGDASGWALLKRVFASVGSWVNNTAAYLSLKAGSSGYLALDAKSSGSDIYFDDVSLKVLTTAELFAVIPTTHADVIARAALTMSDTKSPAGVVVNLDSQTNPQNFVLAYHDKTNAHLVKCVGGVYAAEAINAAATYVAGANIEIRKSGTTYQLFYNGAQVGTDQTIADAGIVANTLHGIFSTGGGSQLNSFFAGAN